MAQSHRWVFTLNNYTDVCQEDLRALSASRCCKYLVFGREVGASGTPHLQGFVIFEDRVRFNTAKSRIHPRAHVEAARGSAIQAADYCKKENDFEEFGQVPKPQGTTNQFADLKAWVLEQERKPTPALVAAEFPSLFIRYGRIMEWIELIYPLRVDQPGEYREYQRSLAERLEADPHPRTIEFIVDPRGGTGKSWFVRKWVSMHDELTQCLSIGKRDDIAHAIDPSKRVFFLDLPRSQAEFLQYSILEQLKDQMVFSPKYNSKMKRLEHRPHVVVFMNEPPDMNKLSIDRYKITYWEDSDYE